ncbi:MAG: hypothetical protein Q8Q09_19630 [Deltaproteobacteria bacterium]|nr:hypothetical protein [Deltaproteobacteria bacterium]
MTDQPPTVVTIHATVRRVRHRAANLLTLLSVLAGSSMCLLSLLGEIPIISPSSVGIMMLTLPFATLIANIFLRYPTHRSDQPLQIASDGTLQLGNSTYNWRKFVWSSLTRGGSLETLTAKLEYGDEITCELPAGSVEQILSVAPILGLRSEMKLRRIFHQILSLMLLLPWLLGACIAIASAVVPIASLSPIVGLVTGTALFVLFYRRWLGVDLTIGTDGLMIRTHFTRRLVRWADITSIVDAGTLVLTLRDGTSRSIWLGHDSGPERHVVFERIQSALALAGREASAQVRASLARGSRTFDQWHQALTMLAHSQDDYRSVSLSDQALRAVLCDSESTAELRMAAALVLRARHGDAVATELRAVAEGLVEPDAQQALRVVSDETLDPVRIESVLSRVKSQ